MKNIFTGITVLVFLFCGWLFYEYKQIAGEAEVQVEKDVLWLSLAFEDMDAVVGENLLDRKYLETQLMQQSINSENKFIRHYRSLFIQEGKKSCLETQVSYFNHNPEIEMQTWLSSGSICTE
jgi:antitoxin component YwqK of YwqJK toxin-antitoxin module